MKITAKMLTNESLVSIVSAVLDAGLLPDDVLIKYYKSGLATQLNTIKRQLDDVQEKSKSKKLTRKQYVVLCQKEHRLIVLANKKLSIYRSLENATNQR